MRIFNMPEREGFSSENIFSFESSYTSRFSIPDLPLKKTLFLGYRKYSHLL